MDYSVWINVLNRIKSCPDMRNEVHISPETVLAVIADELD